MGLYHVGPGANQWEPETTTHYYQTGIHAPVTKQGHEGPIDGWGLSGFPKVGALRILHFSTKNRLKGAGKNGEFCVVP